MKKSNSKNKMPVSKMNKDIEKSTTGNPEISKGIKQVLEMSMQKISGHLPNPILSKLNEKHIDKIIDNTDKDDERQFKHAQSEKRFSLIYLILTLSFFVF